MTADAHPSRPLQQNTCRGATARLLKRRMDRCRVRRHRRRGMAQQATAPSQHTPSPVALVDAMDSRSPPPPCDTWMVNPPRPKGTPSTVPSGDLARPSRAMRVRDCHVRTPSVSSQIRSSVIDPAEDCHLSLQFTRLRCRHRSAAWSGHQKRTFPVGSHRRSGEDPHKGRRNRAEVAAHPVPEHATLYRWLTA